MNSDKLFGKRNKIRAGYIFSGIAVFIIVSGINLFIFRGARLNNRFTARVAVEQKINDFVSSLRGVESNTEIIEITENNRDILGIGTYDSNGESISTIGSGPKSLDPSELFRDKPLDREYIEKKNNMSIIVITKLPKPPRGPRPPRTESQSETDEHLAFRFLLSGTYTYFEIKLVRFWVRLRFLTILFPITELGIAFFTLMIVRLVRKNSEYRKKIEEQKNLVILGTAAGTLAHEIKNPLSAIRLQTSIIERSNKEKNTEELKIINSEIDRLSALTRHVTDYLRDPAGSPETFDPVEIIGPAISLAIGSSSGPVSKNLVELETGPVYIDRERFRSIIENVLLNAVESGSKPEEIEIKLKCKNSFILIVILDRGKGVSAEQIERLFDPFYTTKSSGTGVGLAIAKRFIEAAGGTISVTSRLGGGTEVMLQLPMVSTETMEG